MNGLEETIKTYLGAAETDYAVMINGEWGCGKSYYVEHTLLPEIAKTSFPTQGETEEAEKRKRFRLSRRSKAEEKKEFYKPIKISLYGITDANDFHVHVLYGLYPILKKKWFGVLRTIVSTGGGYFGVDLPKEDSKTFELNLKKHVLIFDDLERISPNLSVVDVMGWINAYAEHEKCKVIIICNEKAIRQQSEIRQDNRYEEYLKYKEKTIRYTIDFLADVSAVYDLVVHKKDPKEKEFYQANKALILDLFACGGDKNIRTLLFVLDCLYKVCRSSLDGPEEITEQLIITFVIYAIEHKKGASRTQLYNFVHAPLDFKQLQLDLENKINNGTDAADAPKEKQEKPLDTSRYVSYYDKMVQMKELVDYIATGELDTNILENSIGRLAAELAKEQGTPQGQLVRELHNFETIQDEEFKGKLEQLEAYVKVNAYDMFELLDVYSLLLRFHYFGIQGFQITERLQQVFKEALDATARTHEYDPRFDAIVPKWDPADKSECAALYNAMKFYANKLNQERYQNNTEEDAAGFMRAIRENDMEKVQAYRQNDNYHGIIYSVDWKEFFELIISEETTNPVACAAIDVAEYWVVRFSGLSEVWKGLYDNLNQYLQAHPLEQRGNHPIRIMMLHPLRTTLEQRMR